MKKHSLKALLVAILALSATAQIHAQAVVFPQAQQPGAAVAAVNGTDYTLSNDLFAATFTKASGTLMFGGSEGLHLLDGTELFTLTLGDGTTVPASGMTLGTVAIESLTGDAAATKGSHRFDGQQLVAHYTYGNLSLTWRAVLRDGSHYLRTELDITAKADQTMTNIIPMIYKVNTVTGGTLSVVGNTRGAVLASDNLFAGLETPMGNNTVSGEHIQGLWSRATTLEAGDTWKVSAVVGLIAEGQARRSFLAYSERERAVPWRPFPLYNSWYELNINRKDNTNPADNMQTAQATGVLNVWKAQLFDAQGVGIKSFVWDDGWDNYGTWTPHANFSFTEPSSIAKCMGAGTGVWLSPVGGYGTSGDSRRAYWTNKGQVMELSNPEYYQVFWDAASNFVNNYNVNFFKFDGISAQSVATGPDTDATGEEDAEGIISMERDIRTLKDDVFLNTTVGTWASPFWYQFTDATWRQENDYGELGNNSIDRENWITYRDNLVYTHYVQNSPLCPINTLMTHGFILSQYGDVSSNTTYEAVLREMRCAFACGSGMVELYCDYSLMNSINGGALWADLAECIRWQEKNADVLPDIHWVGGQPCVKKSSWISSSYTYSVYGWASWNGKKATLALRNGSKSKMTYTTTLREALEIPDYITGVSITLTKAFSHTQDDLSGLATGTAIDIDQQFTVTLPASSVYVFDGVQSSETTFEPSEEEEPTVPVAPTFALNTTATTLTVGETTQLTLTTNSDGAVTYESSNTAVATVDNNGVVTAVAAGTATITASVAATEAYNAASATCDVTVKAVTVEPDPEPQTVSRTISIAANIKFGTCILPFAAAIPSGVEAYACSTIDADSYLNLERATSLQANTPYILYAPNGVNKTIEGVVVDETKDEVKIGLLVGYALNTHTLTLVAGDYVLQNQGQGVMFYNAAGINITIPAGKCYLNTGSSNVKALRIRREGDATDIEEVVEDAEVIIYDLTGRRVKEMQPGRIYIVNGEKWLAD